MFVAPDLILTVKLSNRRVSFISLGAATALNSSVTTKILGRITVENQKTSMPSTVNDLLWTDQNIDHIFVGGMPSIALNFVVELAMELKTFLIIWIGEKVCMVTIENK